MKYEYKKGQYLIDIDFGKGVVIIEDILHMLFDKKILLNINKQFINSKEVKKEINILLDYNFDKDTLLKMLELSIQDYETKENIFKLGKLKIEDYGIYTTLEILKEIGIIDNKFCFIGGQILRFYGVNRQTTDTDILLLADNTFMIQLKEKLFNLGIQIEHYNIDNDTMDPIGSLIRFVYDGIEIDILATKYAFQEEAILNANVFTISSGDLINVISLNDLIIFKIYANSYKDIGDAEALMQLNIDKITEKDISYIYNQLCKLGKEKLFNNLINNERKN